jgi:UPF0042 nucleotide-binding protein
MTEPDTIPVVVLTGLSGGGKSTALRVFEDLGFFCVDGLPAAMVPKLVELYLGQAAATRSRGMAVVMDIRQYDFEEQWEAALKDLTNMGVEPQIIFIDAELDELMRRYAETRRPHPLESHDMGLRQALEKEAELLAPLRKTADLVLDTSHYSIHDLRRTLQEKWNFLEGKTRGFKAHIISFGFKHGMPKEADLVFDLRFLPNPFFDPDLKDRIGTDPDVAAYALGGEVGQTFLAKLLDFLEFLLPLYRAEGRYRLTIALGCTGGRHRSVATAEHVHARLKEGGYSVGLEHRHSHLH